jgi:shikimate dehydrogenase
MGRPYADLIGDPVVHSKSPAIHKFWLEKLGLEGDYRAVNVPPETLPDYLASRRSDPDWRGCNVTMPHKQAILPLLVRRDESVSGVAAANTVVKDGEGELVAHNTDVAGFAEVLRKWPPPQHPYPAHVATYVQIIGAGGAARAVVVGACRAGYSNFDFFNRTLEKARDLAYWMALPPDGYAAPLDALGPIRNPGDGSAEQRYSHVVVNATSMGMAGNPPVPIDLSEYYDDTIVCDLVYEPVETPLLRQARELGLRTADGLEMLVAQAAPAFHLFFGTPAPRERDAELRELLAR